MDGWMENFYKRLTLVIDVGKGYIGIFIVGDDRDEDICCKSSKHFYFQIGWGIVLPDPWIFYKKTFYSTK